jgi:hypothetical protein
MQIESLPKRRKERERRIRNWRKRNVDEKSKKSVNGERWSSSPDRGRGPLRRLLEATIDVTGARLTTREREESADGPSHR